MNGMILLIIIESVSETVSDSKMRCSLIVLCSLLLLFKESFACFGGNVYPFPGFTSYPGYPPRPSSSNRGSANGTKAGNNSPPPNAMPISGFPGALASLSAAAANIGYAKGAAFGALGVGKSIIKHFKMAM